ncbi:helix-turn-helix domain-containing protein [Maribacter dokdonensis]|uniref:AraC-type DNA-binding protein n=1 Tax=Maribacter dokdonensis TaxID=320912 RepID=A0A1H4T3M0_9FLAO|nr:helix-turn-helix domain-containing protein [Maribacter dokdonensis]KSA13976.1 Transcriptional regulator, AraC family [Maribacter dokdonensis DSW-8]SEC51075.1 AraC-type DNA-binding protein [Maribacter dokdonensis]
MNLNTWKTKIKIDLNFDTKTVLLSGNSMGIYFEFYSVNNIIVHFKPLNELFKNSVYTGNSGVLLNFERDLIDEDDVEYALDVMSLFNKYPQLNIRSEKEVAQVKKLIEMLKDEYFGENVSYIMLKTLLKVLLLHLIRFQNNELLPQDIHQKRVFQFLELMEINFLNETNAEYYANQLGISTKRLNQVLQEKLNLTAKQVIQQRQITEAKRKLIRSEITTKELAFDLGFESISSFSRFFKKNVGVSPTAFKAQQNS